MPILCIMTPVTPNRYSPFPSKPGDSTGASERLVSASHDKTVRVWDPTTGVCDRVFTGAYLGGRGCAAGWFASGDEYTTREGMSGAIRCVGRYEAEPSGRYEALVVGAVVLRLKVS